MQPANTAPDVPPDEVVTVDDVDTLVALLNDPHRADPVVLVSQRSSGRSLLSPTAIRRVAGDRAIVRVLTDSGTSWALNEASEGAYATYGGAVRVCARGDWSDAIIVVKPGDDPQGALHRISRAIDSALNTLSKPRRAPAREEAREARNALQALRPRLPSSAIPTPSQLHPPQRPTASEPEPTAADDPAGAASDAAVAESSHAPQITESPSLPGRDGAPNDRPATHPTPVTADDVARLARDIATLTHEVRALRTDISTVVTAVTEPTTPDEVLADQIDALSNTIADVAATSDRRQSALSARLNDVSLYVTELTDDPSTAPVFADAAEQFRYDVQEAWLRHLPEGDRNEHPLRSYTLGSDFLDSATDPKFQLASHAQVVDAVVDVLTRRAYQLPARAAHPKLTSEGGKPLIRADGATGYRCTIAAKAGGPRLLWWELNDGTVELCRIAHHDDMRMR